MHLIVTALYTQGDGKRGDGHDPSRYPWRTMQQWITLQAKLTIHGSCSYSCTTRFGDPKTLHEARLHVHAFEEWHPYSTTYIMHEFTMLLLNNAQSGTGDALQKEAALGLGSRIIDKRMRTLRIERPKPGGSDCLLQLRTRTAEDRADG